MAQNGINKKEVLIKDDLLVPQLCEAFSKVARIKSLAAEHLPGLQFNLPHSRLPMHPCAEVKSVENRQLLGTV